MRVSIKDTGRGIPEKDLPRIFEKFFRVADSEGYATGTGLGLSIVKQIIEAHGSQIDVKSQVDVGTTFSFVLKSGPGGIAPGGGAILRIDPCQLGRGLV